ncbi:tyrosine-type recombinase/integrase [Lacticaseibacillus mingshuiensis]|uniref:tyrosine-type recombinase/integrase n=1 Tax=Lacticaseibacillus mingshuiensis TaxID=2799574 RepID=UPI00194E93BF|nr:site-specific integrase [Lacticaseibacillus mingshuiensis]
MNSHNIEKYIIPNVGNFTLARYSPGQHQRFISDMLDHGGKGGAPLSFNSVQIINATLSNALKKAVQLEYISRNPAVGVEFPRSVKQVHPTLHYWTREQADRFLATAQEENDPVWYYFFLTILDLGLRKGEAMALKWSDVDFATNTININKTRIYRAETGPNSGLVVLDDPKFPASFRTLYMTDRLRAALLEWNKTWYPRPKILSLDEDAPAHGGEDFVFRMRAAPRFYGKVLRDRSTNGAFERIRKSTGLPKIVIHDLRHTLGVFMRESGVPLEDIRDVLGHKDISTTLIYAEVTPLVKKNATAKLNEYLVGDKQKKPTKRPGSANI